MYEGAITYSNQNSGVGIIDSFQFFILYLKQWLSNYFFRTNLKSEIAGLNVPHIEIFDLYYPPVTWKDFTILHSYLQYLHTFTPKRISKAALKKRKQKTKFCICLIFFFCFFKMYVLI